MIPTLTMARAAKEGLARRKEVQRGGTEAGAAMARKIAARKSLSTAEVQKIRSFHARFAHHKKGDPFSAVAIARLLWGGASAHAWATRQLTKQNPSFKTRGNRTVRAPGVVQQSTQRRGVVRNPVNARARAMRKAVRLFRDFHGEHPKMVDEWAITIPPVAMMIGKVTGILYKAEMDGKTQEFLHEFTGHSQPILAASADGRQLLFLGGDYKMTERGIVDGTYTIEGR